MGRRVSSKFRIWSPRVGAALKAELRNYTVGTAHPVTLQVGNRKQGNTSCRDYTPIIPLLKTKNVGPCLLLRSPIMCFEAGLVRTWDMI